MQDILANYEIHATLHESANSLVFRASHKHDHTPVILKLLKQDYPSPEELYRYQQEYDITRQFNDDSIIKVGDLKKHQNTLIILVEDFGGESLALWLKRHSFSLKEGLDLAIKITHGLNLIHANGVIHKDINPSNIIWNPDTQVLKLIDFGIATQLSQEITRFGPPDALEGTLAYLSPEQTGRMNRAVDYRTDFYSLGITLYELFTGQLPFTANDALGWVHCHIAQNALTLNAINPDIPLALSELVMKLMAKNADDRYQSTHGLQHDLEQCLYYLDQNEPWQDFTLGEADYTELFQLPQTLYGREDEVNTLLQTFERVNNGAKEVIWIKGPAGIGKTVLVQEIHQPITIQRGFFISGKYDQLQRSVPYSAFILAFNRWCDAVLTETETELANWRQRLLDAVGNIGQILIDIFPALERVIGPQPTVPALGPEENKNRFHYAFRQFIHVLATAEHPLVLFLDDLQWADLASLELLKLILTDPACQHLLILGSYRDNEVNAAHRLTQTIEELQTTAVPMQSLTLNNLKADDVSQLVAATLQTKNKKTQGLSQLIYEKTQGNAFFVKQFLQALYEEGQLQFDTEHRCWDWNIAQIQEQAITDNVVDLLTNKMEKLPLETQTVLTLGACIGQQFALQTVATIAQQTTATTLPLLWAAVKAGLLAPMDDHYKIISKDTTASPPALFQFTHDRIQQAAYQLTPTKDRPSLHLKIGRLLLAQMTDTNLDQQLFNIVGHYNRAQTLITNNAERLQLAELNFKAGQKAKQATAYNPAQQYFRQGIKLLADDSWQQTYTLTLALHTEATEVAYLNQAYDEMEQHATLVMSQTNEALDRIRIYEIQMLAYHAQYRLQEAFHLGREALKELDVRLPKRLLPLRFLLSLFRTWLMIKNKLDDDFINLPVMTDPQQLAIQKVAGQLQISSFNTQPDLWPFILFQQIKRNIRYGHSAHSCYNCAGFGGLLMMVGFIETGYHIQQLALHLAEQPIAKKFKGRTWITAHATGGHLKISHREALPRLLIDIQTCLEIGDIEFANSNLTYYFIISFFCGENFSAIQKQIARYNEVIEQYSHKLLSSTINLYHQTIYNLQEQTEDPVQLAGHYFEEARELPQYQKENNKSGLCQFHLLKLILAYIFEQTEQLPRFTTLAENYSMPGTFMSTTLPFYAALSKLTFYKNSPKAEQRHLIKQIKNYQKKLKQWAKHVPSIYLHKWYLVEAERLRVLGKTTQASQSYEEAIAGAREHEYLQEEALANELAAKYWHTQGNETVGRVYMTQAHYLYTRWGAMAKVKQLEQHYPQLLSARKDDSNLSNTLQPTNRSTDGTTKPGQLDIETAMKATQAITGEISLAPLLTKLITLLIENAGAQYGCLLLEQDGQWQIEAEGGIEGTPTSILQSLSLKDEDIQRSHLPGTIIYYVIRTQEEIVLDNAHLEERFAKDQYLKIHRPQSLLCLPLLNKGQLTAVLYLENNSAIGTFTGKRLAILRILLAQAAISIENARLFNQSQISEKKFRTVFEDSKDGLFISNNEQIIDTNSAMLAMYGYTREEMLSLDPIKLLVNLDERERFRTQIERDGALKDYEMQVKRKNGTIMNILITATLQQDPDTGEIRYHGIVRDISERKQTEQELANYREHLEELVKARTAELEATQQELVKKERLAVLGQLIATVSHELRNPMGAIRNTLFSLKSTIHKIDQSTLDKIKRIDRNVERCDHIIYELLDYTNIEHVAQEPTYIDDWLVAVITEQNISKDISLQYDLDLTQVELLIDPQRLERAVINIIDNACYAVTPPDPEANSKNAPKITINTRNTDERIEIIIADNGEGIAQEVMEHIFEPLYSTKTYGVGLGMPIVKQIMQLHDGGIEIESKEHQGTRVILWLPTSLVVENVVDDEQNMAK